MCRKSTPRVLEHSTCSTCTCCTRNARPKPAPRNAAREGLACAPLPARCPEPEFRLKRHVKRPQISFATNIGLTAPKFRGISLKHCPNFSRNKVVENAIEILAQGKLRAALCTRRRVQASGERSPESRVVSCVCVVCGLSVPARSIGRDQPQSYLQWNHHMVVSAERTVSKGTKRTGRSAKLSVGTATAL